MEFGIFWLLGGQRHGVAGLLLPPAEQCHQAFNRFLMCLVGRQVVGFVWVGLEIEQL